MAKKVIKTVKISKKELEKLTSQGYLVMITSSPPKGLYMENNGVVARLIMPKLGALEVYTLVPGNAPMDFVHTNFYWRDLSHPQGVGPFPTLYECMESYKDVITGNIKNMHKSNNNVVHVDFKAKRRI